MKRPDEKIIEAVAPSHDIDQLQIVDPGIRNVVGAEMKNSLRLPRGGPHEATLVAISRHYDGLNGGEAGTYLLIYVEFRASGSRWRTSGTKVRVAEAARAARDIVHGKPSKPGKGEAPRVGGVLALDDSTLRGAPVKGGYLLYVRSRGRAGSWVRTRGLIVLDVEKTIVAESLKALAKS